MYAELAEKSVGQEALREWSVFKPNASAAGGALTLRAPILILLRPRDAARARSMPLGCTGSGEVPCDHRRASKARDRERHEIA